MTPDELNRITARIHEDLAEQIAPLAAAYERVLRGAGRKMARKVRSSSLVAAGGPGILPPDEDEVIPETLRDQVDRVTAKERAELVKLAVSAYEAVDVAWDVSGTFTPELLEKIGAHAAFAAEQDLRDAYRGVIVEAAESGYSIPRTAGAITEAVDGVAGYRATALARTDLIGLVNGASQTAATQAFTGRDDVIKVWLATSDDRTRETHADADGQEVPLNEYFDVGGSSMMYPGDPDGPDDEVINCRCTLVYSGGSPEQTEASEEEGEESLSASVLSDTYPAPMTHPDAVSAAVTITVADDATDAPERARTPWEGIMAIAGSPTSDGRYLLPGEIGNRDLPLPVAASHDDQHATETVGRIESIEVIPLADFAKPGWELPPDLPERAEIIWGEGSFDGSEAAQDALRQLENGVGVSLDLPIERQALISAETLEEVDPAGIIDDDIISVLFGGTPEGYLRGMGGKIGGLSLASIAAFEETTIRVVDDVALVASGYAIREVRDPHDNRYTVKTVVASSAPLAPPRAWFFMDEPDEPTPITINSDGSFYGHMALWNTCHAGRANGAFSSCMYAPHSPSGYMHFHLGGGLLCEDGSLVDVGRFTIGTGHAGLELNARAARAHYDNTGTIVAFGRAKDGVFGIWVCGAIKSDATQEQIRDFRVCPPSGDWRGVDGRLEMQAALAVNVPGYPVPRSQLALAASADGLEITALILGAPSHEDYLEALRADYDLQLAEDVDMLVELGVGEFCGSELAALGRVDYRIYSADVRRRLARSGEAMADGSFPIRDCADVLLASIVAEAAPVSAPGALVQAHVRKRAAALGCTV